MPYLNKYAYKKSAEPSNHTARKEGENNNEEEVPDAADMRHAAREGHTGLIQSGRGWAAVDPANALKHRNDDGAPHGSIGGTCHV